MKKNIGILVAAITWFAVVTQYILMMEHKVASGLETTVRFFSFFTILTNTLVAIYFTMALIKRQNGSKSIIEKPGTLTALTVYITIVGLVYQVILRHIWEPTSLQMLVDELLHSVIPLFVIVFWSLYEQKNKVSYGQIPRWLIYPGVYLLYILVRGYFADFYPYPFVDVSSLGLIAVLANSFGLIVLFICVSAIFIKIGKILERRK